MRQTKVLVAKLDHNMLGVDMRINAICCVAISLVGLLSLASGLRSDMNVPINFRGFSTSTYNTASVCMKLSFAHLVTFAVVAFVHSYASGADPAKAKEELKVDVIQKGDSSRATLRAAIAELPLDAIRAADADRARLILKNRTMFRRLPKIAVDADPAVYEYFLTRPEAAVSIWRILKISKFELTPTGRAKWMGKAQDGSKGNIHMVFATARQQLLICEGEYKSPLLPKPIRANALMHMRTKVKQNPDGSPKLVHDLDLFVELPSQAVDTVAKVIAPVSYMVADRNFKELSLFVKFMSVSISRQPGWVERLIQRMTVLDAEEKEELLQIVAKVYVAGRKREVQKAVGEKNSTSSPVRTASGISPRRE
jgi:hypothetical protein